MPNLRHRRLELKKHLTKIQESWILTSICFTLFPLCPHLRFLGRIWIEGKARYLHTVTIMLLLQISKCSVNQAGPRGRFTKLKAQDHLDILCYLSSSKPMLRSQPMVKKGQSSNVWRRTKPVEAFSSNLLSSDKTKNLRRKRIDKLDHNTEEKRERHFRPGYWKNYATIYDNIMSRILYCNINWVCHQ